MKKKDIRGSLIPDIDITIGESYSIEPTNIKSFHDPNFDNAPKKDNLKTGILNIYNNARYGDKTLKELRQWCRDRELPVSGAKKVLIDRLHEHTQKVKKEIEDKDKEEGELRHQELSEEIKVVDKYKVNALDSIETTIERMKKRRLSELDTLTKAQQVFDKTEEELAELKATLKSLSKFL